MSIQILDDRNFAAEFISSLSRYGEIPVTVSFGGLSFLSLLSIRYKKKGIMQILLGNGSQMLQENDKVKVSFCLEDTFLKFETTVIGLLENHSIIKMPNSISSSYRRLVKRYAINEEEGFAFSLHERPLDPIDISAKGIAFTCDENILAKGQEVKKLKIKTPDQTEFYVDGEVRHNEDLGGRRFSYGIKFIKENLALYCELFKYILKKTYTDVIPLNAKDKLSILTGFSRCREERPAVESVAQRVYSDAFLGRQLQPLESIKDMLDSQTILAEVVLAHPCFKYYVTYNENDLALNGVFEEVKKTILDNNMMMVKDIGIYDFDVDSYAFPNMAYSVLKLDNPKEFLDFCETSVDPLEAKCFGYGAEDFYLKKLKKEYKELELSLDRGLWSVYAEGKLLAYVVAEVYSEGEFGNARIYPAAGFTDEALIHAVAARLRGFYARNGKKSFSVVAPGEGQRTVQMVLMDAEGLSMFRKLLTVNPLRYVKYYPLSFPQKAIWNVERFYSGTSIGNVAATVKVKGKLNIRFLRDAINICISQNAALRLRLVEYEGESKQYVSDFKYNDIDYFDFSQKSLAELYKWDEEQTNTPLKLHDSDLFYFAILKMSEEDYGFYFKVHHMVNDGWGTVLTVSRIMKAYSMLKAGRIQRDFESPLYTDYIISEEENEFSERFKKNQEFWNNIFLTMPELTCLKPAPSKFISTKANRKSFVLSDVNAINSFCKTNKTSVFALFMAALSIYLYRTTMQNDMVIGMPVLNRTRIREKETIGMFISTIPIRLNVDADMNFGGYVEFVSRELSRFMKHEDYPFELILEEYRKRHNTADSMYDVVLSYQNATFDNEDCTDNYSARWHFNNNQVEALSLHISDRECDGKFTLNFDYRMDAFTVDEIENFFERLSVLLFDAMSNPSKEIKNLEIISEAEKNKILYEFNDTKVEFPKDKTIHQLFEEQVAKTPDNVAIVFEDKKLTYDELNSRANGLATCLREKGVRPDDIVAIMVERSIEMIVGILGILKAGGAYLPIDPEYPTERVGFMLEDSGTKIILTQESIMGAECCNVAPNLKIVTKSNNLAYVIYTSGSTGQPKGVAIEHRSLVNLCHWHINHFEITSRDRATRFANFSFDASVWELFPYLICGAAVYIIDNDARQDINKLSSYYEENNISVSFLPTQLYEKFAGTKSKSLRKMLTGGEGLRNYVPAEYQVINNYGPTEATVVATSYSVKKRRGNIPIGKPIFNTYIYITDENNQLVPIGVPGELYIAGEGIARGYLNRPELTKERFIEDLFLKGQKVYKTGDIARWLPDGNIEFIGRADGQVKVRGFRIELEEVEKHILNCYTGIKEVVVIVKEDINRGKFLCAFYTAETNISVQEIKENAKHFLPSYMIPAFFVQLTKLPVMPNGKVDRRALEQQEMMLDSGQPFRPPASKTEKIIISEVQQILGINNISMSDNFLDLGGDSLSAMTLVARISKLFHVNLEINTIFEAQSIADICGVIEKIKKETTQTKNHKDAFKKSDLIHKEQQKINSAAVCYFPNEGENFFKIGNEPVVVNRIETSLGAIALIAIPLYAHEIYSEKQKLISASVRAISMAKELGAKAVSLTGLIPSATGYGRDIQANVNDMKITTGHATTSASIVLTLERALEESQRYLENERLCVLGVGSVGMTVLELMLSILPHPRSIVLCDVPAKADFLRDYAKQLQVLTGYEKEIRITCSGPQLPIEVYNSSTIIGATSVANILDVGLLMPGTIVVDDSAPHCFSVEKALRRFKEKGDILFSEGGVLESPEQITKTLCAFASLKDVGLSKYERSLIKENEITGCIFSSLLSANYDFLKPTIGKVNVQDSIQHYKKLKELGFKGAPLHCDDLVLDKENIMKFSTRFKSVKSEKV